MSNSIKINPPVDLLISPTVPNKTYITDGLSALEYLLI